jgi:hypothetical protein
MERFVTYCDLPFLDEYVRVKPDRDKDPANYTEQDHLWLDVHKFLCKSTDVYVNASEEVLEAHRRNPAFNHPYLKHLMDRPAGPHLHLDPAPFENIETASFHRKNATPHALFLVEDTDAAPEVLSRQFGVLFLPVERLFEHWKRIGRYQSLNVSRRGGSSECLKQWRDLERFAAPMTALVVCDQFMLDDREKAQRNLYRMLLHLLPQGPNDVAVDVTLLTRDDKLYGGLESVHRELKDFLDEQRPDLAFNLCVATPQGPNSYHDRHIFTNYGFMKSGQSFNYFNRRGEISVDTTLDFEPLMKELFVARDKLGTVAAAVPSVNEIGVTQVAVGSLENRLFGDDM